MTTLYLDTIISEEGTTNTSQVVLSHESKRKHVFTYYTNKGMAKASFFVALQQHEKLYALDSPVSVESIAQVVKENSLTDPNPVVIQENNMFKLKVTEKETQEEFEKKIDIAYTDVLLLEAKEKAERLAQYEKLKLEFSKGEVV